MKLEAHNYIQHQLAGFLGDVKRQYVRQYISKEEYDLVVESCTALSEKLYLLRERCDHRWSGLRRYENGIEVRICEMCGDHQTKWVDDRRPIGGEGRYSDTEAVFGIPMSMLKEDELPRRR